MKDICPRYVDTPQNWTKKQGAVVIRPSRNWSLVCLLLDLDRLSACLYGCSDLKDTEFKFRCCVIYVYPVGKVYVLIHLILNKDINSIWIIKVC